MDARETKLSRVFEMEARWFWLSDSSAISLTSCDQEI